MKLCMDKEKKHIDMNVKMDKSEYDGKERSTKEPLQAMYANMTGQEDSQEDVNVGMVINTS